MREIKFRAWDKRSEIYLYNVQDVYDMLGGFVKYDNGEVADYDECCFGDFLDNKRYDIEQFAGLKDVNGKDIYENDIVKAYRTCKSDLITFANGSFGIAPDYWHSFESFTNFYGKCEVIGNKFQNPELLEVTE